MYLPKSKYKKPEYTQGSRFTRPDGSFYTGWYVETYQGKYLSGKTPSDSSLVLEDSQLSNESEYTEKKFVSDIIIPTESNYTDGYLIRNFVQDKRNKNIIEVNEVNYSYYLKFRHLVCTQIKWDITFPSENVTKGLYIYYGSASKNEQTVLEAEKIISNLSTYIKSYSQFVRM